MTKRQRKIFTIITAFIILLLALSAGLSATVTPPARAVVLTDNNFDNTKVEDDLADIDIERVKADYTDMAIVEFVEYCYSDNVFNQGNYGLYLYIYNPERKVLSIQDNANVVNMAVGYNSDGQPNAYENKPLKYLNKTTGDNSNLFYKFKVADVGELLPIVKVYNKAYGKRRYDIASIQLREVGATNAKDYDVAYTYNFTGYAKGYGTDSNAESTLNCDITELETLRLSVKSTFFRPNGFNGENTRNQDQLNSVYFSIPDSILKKYGSITEIHAEWYEYRTKPLFVTGNKNVYNGLKNYVGRDISTIYDSDASFSSAVKYGFAAGYGADYNGNEFADYGYNLSDYYPAGATVHPNGKRLTQLDWLFYAENGAGKRNVTSDELLQWAETQSGGKTDLIRDKYARDLFTENVGEKRKADYNNVHIKADIQYDLRNFNLGSSFWDKLFNNYTADYAEVKAIEAVTNIPTLADSNKLYVDDTDIDEFISYVKAAKEKDESETTYLFRFALTDYYSIQAYNVENIKRFGVNVTNELDKDAYLCMENVFIDFDIIDITFCRDGVYTVIPVVSDPIDIFPDTEPPPDFNDGNGCKDALKTVLMIVGVVLLVIIVIKLISWIVKKVKKANNDKASAQKRKTKKRKKQKRQ